MVPQDGATTDDEKAGCQGEFSSGLFMLVEPAYPDWGSSATVSDLNSLRWQEATPENSDRTEPGGRM